MRGEETKCGTWEGLSHQLSVLTVHEQKGGIEKYPDMSGCSQGILSQILPDCKWGES